MTTGATSRRQFLNLAGAWVAAASAAGCGSCPERTSFAWNNAVHTDGIDACLLTPGSLPELVRIVKSVEARGGRVRMVGSGHSFSDAAMTSDTMLLSTGLQRPLELNRSQLRDAYQQDHTLVRVESGIPLRSLNPLLWKRGLSLQNMGGFDAQTIVGAAMTGTHGSGLGHGPIASQIVSLQVVVAGGRVLQVEPTNGITDPARFQGVIYTPAGHVAAQLVQDDEVFSALVISMGCMGIVYAVVLQATQRYWLEEVRQEASWRSLSSPGGFVHRVINGQSLADGSGRVPDFYEVYVNPYEINGDHKCIVTRRFKLLQDPGPGTTDSNKRGRLGDSFLRALQKLTKQGDSLAQFMNNHTDRVPGLLDQSLASLVDKSYIKRGYQVFHIGPPNDLRVFGIEVAVDLADAIKLVELLFSRAASLMEQDGLFHSSPPSLRFVAPSAAPLAMMHGRQTATLEIGMLTCTTEAARILNSYERYFIRELNARPHWGLDMNTLTAREVARLYPKFAAWHKHYRKLNASGVFNGRLTDRLGISV